MAAAAVGMRDVVQLEPNVPVEVALLFPTGKPVMNGERMMFSLVDGRVMFLDPEPAERIAQLGLKPRGTVRLCLKWSGKRGDRKEVSVERVGVKNEIRGAVPVSSGDGEKMVSRAREWKERSGGKPAQAPPITQAWAQNVLSLSNALTDVYAAAVAYAERHGERVSREDVRSFVETAFAAQHRDGGPYVS